jgi:hypothetical protein
MDDGKLTQLLWHDSADLTAATPFCPEDSLVAAYFEGTLGELGRGRLRNHLVECRYCQARLGNLARSASSSEDPLVPAQVLAEAKQMGNQATPKRRNWRTPAWAAAAVLVLAVTLIFSGQLRQAPGNAPIQPIDPATDTDTRQLRSLGNYPSEIRIVEPTHGAILTPEAVVRWVGVPGIDRYEVFILTASGDLAWSERLDDTNWSPREAQGLVPGDRYYLRVEATLRDGTTVSSRHMDFRFTER